MHAKFHIADIEIFYSYIRFHNNPDTFATVKVF